MKIHSLQIRAGHSLLVRNHFSNDVFDQMESEGMHVNDSANDSRWGRGRGGKAEPTHAFLKLLNEPQLLIEELESINASPRPELAGLDGKDLLSH